MKFVFLFLIALASSAFAQSELVNGVAVIVNDKVITFRDVQSSLSQEIDSLERRYAAQPQVLEQKLKQLQADRVQELVENYLVLNEYSSKYSNAIPETYFESRINDEVKHFGDRLTLTKTLQAQGITYETFRNRIREKVILESMWHQKVPRDPVISPHKMEEFYKEHQDKYKLDDQVKLRMIVITNRPGDKTFSASRLANEILTKINEGAPFEDMARIYSQGSQASEGGLWGWVEKSVLRPELSKAAFAMTPGKQSQIIDTGDAAYIMRVEETRPAHVRPLAEVRDEIEATLKTEETKRLRKVWIDHLTKNSFVLYF